MKPLRQKLLDTLALRGYSPRTVESYMKSVEMLSKVYWRSPEKISNEEVTEYLLRGLREEHWSASTLNVRVSGLRFFYHHVLGRSLAEVESAIPRTKRPRRCPRVYSREELELLFEKGCMNEKQRAFLMTLYGAGLRLGEACRLKVSDIESRQRRIRVEQGTVTATAERRSPSPARCLRKQLHRCTAQRAAPLSFHPFRSRRSLPLSYLAVRAAVARNSSSGKSVHAESVR